MLQKISDNTYARSPLQADEGFQFGRAVYETLPVFQQPVLLSAHVERLNKASRALNIGTTLTAEELAEDISALAFNNCVLKIMVSPANLVYQTRPLPAKEISVKLQLKDDLRSRQPELLRYKTVQYLAGLIAYEQAIAQGFDDALLVNPEGYIAECTRSNIVLIRDDQLLTPDLACGLLPGIARDWLLANYPVKTGFYRVSDLKDVQGAFICNSVRGFRPVTTVDDKKWPVHPLANEIQASFQKKILDKAK